MKLTIYYTRRHAYMARYISLKYITLTHVIIVFEHYYTNKIILQQCDADHYITLAMETFSKGGVPSLSPAKDGNLG